MSKTLTPERFVVSFYKDSVGTVESPNQADADIIFGQVTIMWAKVLMKIPGRRVLKSGGHDSVELCQSVLKSAGEKAAGAKYLIVFVENGSIRKLSASSQADAEAIYDQIPSERVRLLIEVPTAEILKTHGFNPWTQQFECVFLTKSSMSRKAFTLSKGGRSEGSGSNKNKQTSSTHPPSSAPVVGHQRHSVQLDSTMKAAEINEFLALRSNLPSSPTFNMPPSTDCHPCLPPSLLEKLKSDPVLSVSNSCIFQSDFDRFRLGANKFGNNRTCVETEVVQPCNEKAAMFPGFPEQLARNMERFGRGDRKTFLHVAARNGDVPLAYEVIRMGIIIDYKDKYGATALFLALEHLLSLSMVLKTVSQSGFLRPADPASRAALDPATIKNKIACTTRIATLLIEQHADVDAGAFGYTPLYLACSSPSSQGASVRLTRRQASLLIYLRQDQSRRSSPRSSMPLLVWQALVSMPRRIHTTLP
ncbi:hypothetical protein NM688_g8350 [Phlebia brevispora]|uniref:Uncharacterized protein n=1 Tax=Phlebia brevispora TaxID=194682 RepID=A0ACC1RTH5_9APHY|nr:hypothetical protein NM688_g8350 [Phlebia brevispora]